MSSPDPARTKRTPAATGERRRPARVPFARECNAVVFRADAGAAIGTGHVMRCLALAAALAREGVSVSLVSAGGIPSLMPRLEQAGIALHTIEAPAGSVQDAEATCAVAKKASARWIVADGYHFCSGFQEAVKEAGHRLLVIDDYGHSDRYSADIILNQYPYAAPDLYRVRGQGDAILLLGTRYALLRDEFVAAREHGHAIPKTARKVLVTLGGGDAGNVTGLIVHALQDLPAGSLELTVVAGGCNPHYEELADLAGRSRHPTRLLRNVGDMAALYREADCAIASGGSTTLELACLGIPTITVVIAENQEPVCRCLAEAGAAVNAGWMDGTNLSALPGIVRRVLRSAALRRRLSENARRLVDGKGAVRVMAYLKDDLLHARRAQERDCRMIYGWANDPYVRKISFSTAPITPAEHKDWFLKKIADYGVVYLIIEDAENRPVGQVRFDTGNGEAVVSITIAPEFRGRNYGTVALRLSAELLFRKRDVRTIHAYIKKGNTISCRAFHRAGFAVRGTCRKGPHEAIHMTLERGEG